MVSFIVIFSIFITIKYRNTEEYRKTRLSVFFSTLASVAIIFVCINILLSSLSFESNQKLSQQAKTKEAVDKFWLYPNQLLESSSNLRPEFKASFFMNNPELYNLVVGEKNSQAATIATKAQEQFIANVIIQAWEDCLIIRNYDTTPMKFWLRSFITWAQSPYLKYYYSRVENSYADNTRILATLLFEYAKYLPTPVEDTNLYIRIVDKLMKDPRYIALMKSL